MQVQRVVKKPTKQRKMLYQAPDHIRHKLLAAPLSPELKASHGIKSLPVRNGDTVRVMRGDRKGFEGKVTRVDLEKYRIYLEGLTREKVDGTTIFVPSHPSKVMITSLNLEDKWRKKILERKKKEVRKKLEEVEEKLPQEVVEVAEEKIEEKAPKEKRPKRRARKTAKKPVAKKTEKIEETKEKPTKKKRKTKRKVAKKTGEEA